MATSNEIIQNCKKYLGMPYVWGGESKEEGGFDCSGYLYNVLRDSGYKVGRTTAHEFSKLGTSVSKSEMRAGDLLFFGNANKITHCAIYAGNNKMYESLGGSSNTKANPGKGVVLSDLSRRKDLYVIKRISTDTAKKSIDEIAKEVIRGNFGNGEERKQRLEKAGYNYREVQNRVNEMLR